MLVSLINRTLLLLNLYLSIFISLKSLSEALALDFNERKRTMVEILHKMFDNSILEICLFTGKEYMGSTYAKVVYT